MRNPSPTRPRVLAVLPQFIPSTVLTVVKPLTALHRSRRITADITLESWVSRRKVEQADVVVFCRNNEPQHGQTLETALALGKPVIYELDDNFFELPKYYPRERRYLTPERLAQLELYLRSATLVRVYSEPLRERVERLNPAVVRVDGPVDWDLVPTAPPTRDPDKIRIVYVTSRIREDDLVALFISDVERLLQSHRGRIEVCWWGYHPPALRGNPFVRFLDFVPDYDRFFRQFARSGFDIGLAPLRDDVFHRSKTNNKFREYAAARVAGVYSNVDVYTSCVEHGRTGLLVSEEPGAWFTALSRLIEDASLRTSIQRQAFRFARTHYGLEKTQPIWLEHLDAVLTADRKHAVSHSPASSAPPRETGARQGVPEKLKHATRRAVHLAKAMRIHGMGATVNRVQRTLKDWRLLSHVKWNLWWARLSTCVSTTTGAVAMEANSPQLEASRSDGLQHSSPGTVIIVNFNTRSLLRESLASVHAHMPKSPVVVVDNASTDGSAAMVAEEFPTARLIRNQSNVGFGTANNQALAEVTTEFVLLLNSDAQVEHDVILALARTMDEHPNAGLVGCRLMSGEGEIQRSARRFPSARRSLRNALALPDPIPANLAEVDYVDSAAALARTSALREVSGFDQRFFLYAEDADLCRRLRNVGWTVLYDPRVSVIHLGGGSTDRGSLEDDRLRWEALALYASTHFGPMDYATFLVARPLELLRQSVTATVRAALQGDSTARQVRRSALRELRWHAGYWRARTRRNARCAGR